MALLVCVTGWDRDVWAARLRRIAPMRDIRIWPDIGNPADVTYAAVWKHPPGLLSQFSNLKGVISLGAGVDHLFSDPGLPDVPLARVIDPDLTTRMSEWVVMHALMLLRQQRGYDAQQAADVWADIDPAPAAADLRVGVMGLGVLGQDAARKLAVMGFPVTGWSRSAREVTGLRTFSGDALPAFLAETDLLVSLLPLTPDTAGLLNYGLFRQLARDGVFGAPMLMNSGRGGLQVEADILHALDDGVLRAATLDVFETEPLPSASRLWRHPRVTVSPHNAAISDPDAVGAFVLRQVDRAERGLPFETPVDRAARY